MVGLFRVSLQLFPCWSKYSTLPSIGLIGSTVTNKYRIYSCVEYQNQLRIDSSLSSLLRNKCCIFFIWVSFHLGIIQHFILIGACLMVGWLVYDFMDSCNHVIRQSCNHGIIQSCNHAIIQSYNHAIMQSCNHAIMQSCNHLYIDSCIHGLIDSWNHILME